MSRTAGEFARVKIDALLKDAGWDLANGTNVVFEFSCRHTFRLRALRPAGRSMAALEAKHAGVDTVAVQDQGRHYASEPCCPMRK